MAQAEQLDQRASEQKPPALSRLRGWVAMTLQMAGGGVTLLVLASFAAFLSWRLDLLTHFRPQLCLVLLAIAGATLVTRFRSYAVVWFVAAMLSVFPVFARTVVVASDALVGEVELVHANLGDVDLDALEAWLATFASDGGPDLLLFQEATPRSVRELESRLDDYEVLAAAAQWDTRGVAAFVRRDLAETHDAKVLRPTSDQRRPMIEVSTDREGRAIAILHFHTTRPTGELLHQTQAEHFNAAAGWARIQASLGRNAVVVGDFNASTQGVLVQRLMNEANLADLGGALGGTYPSAAPWPMLVPIDNCLVSPSLSQPRGGSAVAVSPHLGGDHRAIHVRIGVPATARRGRSSLDVTEAQRSRTRASGLPASSERSLPAETPATRPAGSPAE